MRVITGCLAFIVASLAQAALPNESSPIYLRGYYRLYDRNSVWKYS